MSPERRRINHWSPWGADPSGITNYTSHLVPALNQFVDVTVVHPHEVDPVLRTRTPSDVAEPTLDDAQVNLFHVGNHLSFHHWMVAPIVRHGGIVVLHDWSVFDIFRPMFYRSWHLWERELIYNGETDRDLAKRRGDPGFLMAHPMNRRIIDGADVIIVHTEWVRRLATQRFPNADIRYIPHGGHVWPSQPITSTSPITVLGGVGKHKKVSTVIEAFSAISSAHSSARLRIVGRGEDRHEIQHLRDLIMELGLTERVEWHLDVSREEYLRLLGESLLIVTLRGDTAGEMSGVLVEAWGAGRVAITSDQPQFADFDPTYCRRVSTGDSGASELAEAMDHALSDPEQCARDGQAALELIRGEYSFDSVARSYADVIEEIASRAERDATRGVNLYGSWGTPTGLTEAARRQACALIEGSVPISLPYGLRLEPFDSALVPRQFARTPRRARYAINLLTANINEFHEVPASVLGGSSARRWNIAEWIYEFSDVPAIFMPRFSLVDEIWAPTQFAADTFRRYFDGPVTTIPYVVEPRRQTVSRELTRERYGIRPDALAVMFSFDYRSGWARKNPLAVIAACRDALSAENTQLVMKVSRVTAHYRRELERAMAGVDGVIIDDHLSDPDLSNLFHAIDVYCSLHRAEGFGLGMAEAMAIGKTVVATNYSGNLDFTTPTTSLLVEVRLRAMNEADVESNEGLRSIAPLGSLWAEPDHDSAVTALRRCLDSELRQRLGVAGREIIAAQYSTEAVVRQTRGRLDALHHELGAFRSEWPRVPVAS